MFNLKLLTEEQKQAVRNYFQTGDLWWFTESQIFIMYWRMKAHGIRIDKAEEIIADCIRKKQESYKWIKENEMNSHLKDYKQETWWEVGVYSFVRLKDWDWWKTLVLWVPKSYDAENDKQRRSHVVEIEERMNPTYFQDLLKKYGVLSD